MRLRTVAAVSLLLGISWSLSYIHSRAQAETAPEATSWAVGNNGVTGRLAMLADGSLALTSLREPGKQREWSTGDDELLRIEGVYRGRPFQISGRDPWKLLSSERIRQGSERIVRLRLRSLRLPLYATLRLHARPGRGPLEFDYTIAAAGRDAITITRADSLSLELPLEQDRARLHWVQKGRPDIRGLWKESQDLEPAGEKRRHVLLCSAGTDREFTESVPFLALENGGGGWYFGWAFSGYGRFETERVGTRARFHGGLDGEYFRHELRPGASLAVPPCLIGVYSGSLDRGLSDLHVFLREQWLPPTGDPRFPRVQYNTWTALYEGVNQQNVLEQMASARDLGAELFQLDAGWYRTVGDWQPDPARFPRGIRYLSDQAHRASMKFGLGVAWTQVGPRLLRQHPEWLVREDIDAESYRFEGFTSLTLCPGHRPFREWAKRELDRIIREYGLDYLEFDGDLIPVCRRSDHTHQPGDGGYAATQGFYEVVDWIRARHPNLLIENCSNGGRILDYGILRRTHLACLSDLYGPDDNRRATYGATFPFPPQICESYMAAAPGDPEEQFRSCMMGLWNISTDTTLWEPSKRDLCKQEIERYQALRPLIRNAVVHHVLGQAQGPAHWDGMAYENRAQRSGALFAFRSPMGPDAGRVRLPFLASASGAPEARYRVRWAGAENTAIYSGRELADSGVPVRYDRLRRSQIVTWAPSE